MGMVALDLPSPMQGDIVLHEFFCPKHPSPMQDVLHESNKKQSLTMPGQPLRRVSRDLDGAHLSFVEDLLGRWNRYDDSPTPAEARFAVALCSGAEDG